jgi:hypothetical protein
MLGLKIQELTIQLQKALARFWCGNTQLELVLSVWKDVSYVERFCHLGKVEDEKHLLLVYPNRERVREHFCLDLPLTDIKYIAS